MKTFKHIVFFALMLTGFLACEQEEQEIVVTSISLNHTSIDIPTSQTVHLLATILPENATNKTIVWTSSDEQIATVQEGIVTTLNIGRTIIKATCGDKSASCIVNVTPIDVESITLNAESSALKIGETVTLTATVKPDDATDKTVTWTTSDATVATVSDGIVTAKKVGRRWVLPPLPPRQEIRLLPVPSQ